MNIIDKCLVATVDAHPDDDDIRTLQKKIMNRIEGTSIRCVLIDMSKVRILDSIQFSILADSAKTFSLLGAKTVFVGFQAGVAASLVDLDLDLGGIETAVTMAEGLEMLRSFRPADQEVIEPEDEVAIVENPMD